MTANRELFSKRFLEQQTCATTGESDSYSPLQIAAQPIPVDLSYTSHASVEAVGEG